MIVIPSGRGVLGSAAAPAPSGIAVAGAASVVISNAPSGLYSSFNGTYDKKVNPERCLGIIDFGSSLFVFSGVVYASGLSENFAKILIQPQATLTDDLNEGTPDKLTTPSNTWKLVEAGFDGEFNNFPEFTVITNSSTDQDYIPTSGWSQSLTIT